MNPLRMITGWMKLKSGDSKDFAHVTAAKELRTFDPQVLQQLIDMLGADGTYTHQPPGGAGLIGYLSQLGHDSQHFSKETLTQRGEVRVAPKFTQFSLSSRYPISVLRDTTTLAGAGTVTHAAGLYVAATGAAANGSAALDSRDRGNYICGLGAIADMSVQVPVLPASDQIGEWYYGDASDGYGFGVDATSPYIFWTKAAAKTIVRQQNWNQDTLDGSGHSGVTLDLTKGVVCAIEFNWFSFGQVKWIFFTQGADGRQHKTGIHVISGLTTNGSTIENANLPIGVKALNGAAGGAFEVRCGGRAFATLGDNKTMRRVTSHPRFNFGLANNTNFQYVMGIRHKTGGSFANVRAYMEALDIISANDVYIEFWQDVTITGANWTAPQNHPASETCLEFDVAGAVAGIGTGVPIHASLYAVQGRSDNDDRDYDDIIIPPGATIAIMCRNTTGGAATLQFGSRWNEDW